MAIMRPTPVCQRPHTTAPHPRHRTYPCLLRGLVNGLYRDYANYGWAIDSRVRTWRSASRPDTDQMEFHMPSDEAKMLIHGYARPAGTFRIEPGAPEQVTAIDRFFGKHVIVTCQPWQTERHDRSLSRAALRGHGVGRRRVGIDDVRQH